MGRMDTGSENPASGRPKFALPKLPALPAVSRRKLLIGAGAAAGLVIGYAVWPRRVPLNVAVRDNELLINAWLKIGPDGRIVVQVPQAEMGQGVYTALPQIVAHELGADWRMVGVEPAPIHPVFANRAFAGEEGDASMLAGIGRWVGRQVIERYAVQATGGSTSIVAFMEPLRAAGAVARVVFLKAGARRFGVDWEDCDSIDGHVVAPDGSKVSFADLVADLDVDDAPDEAEPRADDRGNLLGRPLPRLDTPAKVDGSARFGADVRLPSMLYAAVRGAAVPGDVYAVLDRWLDADLRAGEATDEIGSTLVQTSDGC